MALDLAFLKKKAGPLTYGEWSAVVTVAIVLAVWYRRKHGGTTVDPNAATPDPTGASQLPGGGGLGGSVPTGGVPGADNPPTTTDSGSSGIGGNGTASGAGGWLDPGNTNTGGTSNTGGSSGGFLGDNTPASGAGGLGSPGIQGTYVVKNGDNWITIADQFGVSESDLLAVNASRGPSALKSGETIYLPAGAHLGGSSGSGSGVVGYYTVVSGDNWLTVASRAGVSESALLAANASRGPGALRAGDQLAIPSGGHVPTGSSGSGSGSGSGSSGGVVGYYTVGGGDNWLTVASRAGVSESALLAANASRGPGALRVGDRLAIPSGGHVPAASNTTKNTSTPGKTSAVSSYTVKAGDNWLTVAAKFGESEAQLLADNASRGPSALRAGNVLKVRG